MEVCQEVIYIGATGRRLRKSRICGQVLPCSLHGGDLVREMIQSVVGEDVKVEMPDEPLMLSLGEFTRNPMQPIAFIKPAEVADYATFMTQLPMPNIKDGQINIGMWNMMKAIGSEGKYVTWGGDQVNVNFEARGKRKKNSVVDVAAALMEKSDVMCIFQLDVFFYILRKLQKRGLPVAGILCLNGIKPIPKEEKSKKGYQWGDSKDPLQEMVLQFLTSPEVTKFFVGKNEEDYLSDTNIRRRYHLSKDATEAKVAEKRKELTQSMEKHGNVTSLSSVKSTNEVLRSDPAAQVLYESYNQVCGKVFGPAYASFYGLEGDDLYLSPPGYGIFFNPHKVKLVKAGSSNYSSEHMQKHELQGSMKKFNIFTVPNETSFACVFEKNGCEFNVVMHNDSNFSSFVNDKTFVLQSGDNQLNEPQAFRSDAIATNGNNLSITITKGLEAAELKYDQLDNIFYAQSMFQLLPVCNQDFCFQRMDFSLEMKKLIQFFGAKQNRRQINIDTPKLKISEYNEVEKSTLDIISALLTKPINDNLATLFTSVDEKGDFLYFPKTEDENGLTLRVFMDPIKQFMLGIYPNAQAASNHPPFLRSFVLCK